MHFLAPGLPNQSHMLGTTSSFCHRRGPAIIHHSLPFPTARPQSSGIKSNNFSIANKLSIQQTAPDSPSQGCHGFPWCSPIPTLLPQPYVLSLYYSYIGLQLTCHTISLPPPLSQSNYHWTMDRGWRKQQAISDGPWEYGNIWRLVGRSGIVQLSTVGL